MDLFWIELWLALRFHTQESTFEIELSRPPVRCRRYMSCPTSAVSFAQNQSRVLTAQVHDSPVHLPDLGLALTHCPYSHHTYFLTTMVVQSQHLVLQNQLRLRTLTRLECLRDIGPPSPVMSYAASTIIMKAKLVDRPPPSVYPPC